MARAPAPALAPRAPAPRAFALAALVLAALVLGGAAATAAAWAQGSPAVAYSGRMAERAVLVIDGQPRTVAVGASVAGVKLLSLSDTAARVETRAGVLTLPLGASPVSVGAAPSSAGAGEIVLTAGPGGHFVTTGAINNRPVRFLVDTGATLVALGQADAERLGLDLRQAERGMAQTANGAVPVHRLTLGAVTVGEVTLSNVQAVVLPGAMPYVLLGNSFLTRFQMRRDNDQMRLQRRD